MAQKFSNQEKQRSPSFCILVNFPFINSPPPKKMSLNTLKLLFLKSPFSITSKIISTACRQDKLCFANQIARVFTRVYYRVEILVLGYKWWLHAWPIHLFLKSSNNDDILEKKRYQECTLITPPHHFKGPIRKQNSGVLYLNVCKFLISLYQSTSLSVSEWVSLSVWMFPNSSETANPSELKFWGMIPLGIGKVLG